MESPSATELHGGAHDSRQPKQQRTRGDDGDDQFRTLAESLPQMVFTCDAQGHKTYCCQRYLDYTGVSSCVEMDRVWTNLIHPDDRERVMEAWAHSVQTGHNYAVDYRLERQDGVYRHHLARAVPTRSAAGEIMTWVGTITDMQEEKQKEKLLLRTEKLAATGRIAASIAHEINNPLTSVINSLFLALQDKNLSVSTRQYLKLADQELARVAQFTTQSLRMYKQSVSPKPTDLGEVMDSALGIYRERFKANSIVVECRYRDKDRLYCRVDEMRQAFAHLLSNSLDAMPQGGSVRIRIQPARTWDAQNVTGVKVIVADTGMGISNEMIPQIFDAFTSTKDPTGVGLGLWVVDGIMRKHKGRVAVRSRTGLRHGTIFSVFFPFLGLTD
jgi:PAS domain S-box-containing protein